MTFIKNIKDAFAASSDEQDRGTLVETVIMIAGFAVLAIFVVSLFGNAIAGVGADSAKCITSANTFTSTASAQTACTSGTNAKAADAANTKALGDSRFK